MLAHAYGCRCHIAMPDDAAEEKGRILEALGEVYNMPSPLSTTGHDTSMQIKLLDFANSVYHHANHVCRRPSWKMLLNHCVSHSAYIACMI